MGFEDILRRRLGPMRDLVGPSHTIPAPEVGAAEVWYRRAVGLDRKLHASRSKRPRSSPALGGDRSASAARLVAGGSRMSLVVSARRD